MDGRGAWRDNVFVECISRSVKYERMYLMAYDGVSAARTDIADYFGRYNTSKTAFESGPCYARAVYLDLLSKLAEAA